ncbi:MAG: hypothetical protein KF867_03110 [Cryobacterium sp.]|nr:hypothetical protein [Cryobacterium sp.]
MPGKGLIIAGAILAIVRGAIQFVVAGLNVRSLSLLETIFPGISVGIWFELIMAIALIAGGVVCLFKSTSFASRPNIRIFGIAVIVLGIVDLVFTGVLTSSIASGIGSFLLCLLIGLLLIAGSAKKATPVSLGN